MKKTNRGFTLIELLVVIAIIAILAAIIMVPLNSARQKARDMKRVADLKTLEVALEMFFDANKKYPPEDSVATTALVPMADSLTFDLVPSNISVIPVDPSRTSGTDRYSYCSNANGITIIDATSYILRSVMENSTNTPTDKYATTELGCTCAGTTDYCIKH